jgi:hypothetical protein
MTIHVSIVGKPSIRIVYTFEPHLERGRKQWDARARGERPLRGRDPRGNHRWELRLGVKGFLRKRMGEACFGPARS